MERIKQFLFLMIAVLIPAVTFTACGDDDEPEVKITEADVIGTWNVTQMTEGKESVDVPAGYVTFNIKSNHDYSVRFLTNSYVGTWKLEGNTVVGTTLDPITERLTFSALNGKNATINYSNSDGDKYVLKATKN